MLNTKRDGEDALNPDARQDAQMLVLNFSHPLMQQQVEQIEALAGQQVREARDLPVHFDEAQDFARQSAALADACGLSAEAWQTTPILVVPPSLNFIAVTLLAELHGRMGYFPPVVRLRPAAAALPPRYEIAEIIDLQAVRSAARQNRYI